MIRKVENGYFSGFVVENSNVSISSLLYADDTMIFGKAEVIQLGYVRCILRCFKAVSGLKINLVRCEMFKVGDGKEI